MGASQKEPILISRFERMPCETAFNILPKIKAEEIMTNPHINAVLNMDAGNDLKPCLKI